MKNSLHLERSPGSTRVIERRKACLAALLLTSALAACDAPQPTQPPEPPAIFAEDNAAIGGGLGGRPRALAIDGDLAYLAIGPRLVVVDLEDPADPRQVGWRPLLPAPPEDVAVGGGRAYLVGGDLGLSIFDVSRLDRPREIGTIALPTPPAGSGDSPVPEPSREPSAGPEEDAASPGSTRVHARAVAVRDGRAYVVGEVGPDTAPAVAGGDSGAGRDPAADSGAGNGELTASSPAATATALAAAIGGKVDRSGAASRLLVFDVADPEAPRLVGQADFPGRAADIALDEDHAFVAARQGGLRVIDIADPARPRPVGHAPSPASAVGVAVVDGYGFVAEDDPAGSGLQVIDLRDPAAPAELAGVTLARRQPAVPVAVRGITVGDGRAWLATSDGLRAVDVADPESPREVAAVAAGGVDARAGVNSPAAAGSSADVSPLTGAGPRPGSSIAAIGASAVALADDRLVLLDLGRGLEVLGPDAAGNWKSLGEWPTLTRVTDVLALDRPDKLLTISAGRPMLVDLLGRADFGRSSGYDPGHSVQPIELPGRLDRFAVDGSRLYATVIIAPADPSATEETLGLAIVEMEGAEGPALHAVLPLTDYSFDPTSVVVIENKVWVKLRDGAWLAVDVADPAAPQVLGRIAREGRGEILTAADGRLVVASNDPGSGGGWLELLDPTDPLHPILLGSTAIASDPAAIAVRDGRAYVASRETLQIVDLSTPEAPRVVGTVPLPQAPRAVALRDFGETRQVLIALGAQGLLAVDVTDPAVPRLAGDWTAGDRAAAPVLGVAPLGGVVYLAGGDAGLRVLVPGGD